MPGCDAALGALALVAAVVAGPAAAPSQAGPACSAAISPAWVVDDAAVGWMVGASSVSAACDPAWRLALSPQYQTDDGLWHGGRRVFAHISYPAANASFDAGSSHTMGVACYILSWDDGDGTEAFTPPCRYLWRIHAGSGRRRRSAP